MSLFVESSFWVFLLVTVVLGGGAAFMAGHSLAKDWRSITQLLIFMIPLGLGVRFLHFALFQQNLFSLQYFITHTFILMGLACLGYRLKRVSQMVTQYPWLYERSGMLTWRNKS
ncbi:MAG: DUF6867 family protein [Aestuariivirga sp.]|jgi:hypothetical protein